MIQTDQLLSGKYEAIQPFGCLLRFNADLSRVQQVSENLEQMVGISIEAALKATPRELLDGKLLERIEKSLKNRQRMVSAAVISRQVAGTYQRFYVMAIIVAIRLWSSSSRYHVPVNNA